MMTPRANSTPWSPALPPSKGSILPPPFLLLSNAEVLRVVPLYPAAGALCPAAGEWFCPPAKIIKGPWVPLGLLSGWLRWRNVRPSLNQLAVSDTPDHDAGKFVYRSRGRFRSRPVVADNDFITLGNQIQNLDKDVKKF